MKSIHVRNIFQLVIPLQAPPNSLSVVSHLLTSGDEFGFAVVDMLSKGKFEYKVHILNAFYGTKKGDAVVQNCLAWAKRNPISFQNDKDSGDIVGIILRLKVQQGFFDFRRIAKQNIQLKVDCLSDMAQSFCKIASSEIIQLLPKKRKGKYDIEVVIPLVWRDENYDVAQDLSSIEYSLENSPEMVYHSTEAAYSSSPEQQSYINFNPTTVYEESNQLELSVVNEGPAEMYNVPVHNGSNSNEQYMVLYNGNAEVIGNFRALNFYKASDINIKEDIRLISEFADARDVLMKIDGVDYKFKKGVNAAVNRRFVGYIAQQVESVVPDAVQLIDGILHVDYESLIPYLSESIRANLNDIKENQAKTERIEKVVDMLYQQFLKQSKGGMTDTKVATSTSKITPKQRSKKFSWKIITAAVVSTALVAIIATVLFFTLSTDGTTSPRPVTPSPVDIDERRRILEELFIATNGTNWKNKTGWMTNTSICSWHGVCGCDTMFWLCLQDNNLQGSLPESLGYLPLHRVSMSGNKLEGSLPSSFYQQNGMTTLDLSNNMLTHVNVKALFKLPNLVDVNLSNNRITGVLEISPDSLMTRLDLSYNQFMGTVPNLESLESLQRLDLSHNSFQGSVPSLPLRGLSYLSLESNQFEGEIWRLNHFTKLEELNLANNNFEGEVPFDEDQLSRMSYLNMSHNKFSSVRASNITLIQDDFICDATNVSFECPIPDWLAIRCAAKCS